VLKLQLKMSEKSKQLKFFEINENITKEYFCYFSEKILKNIEKFSKI